MCWKVYSFIFTAVVTENQSEANKKSLQAKNSWKLITEAKYTSTSEIKSAMESVIANNS